MIRMKLFAQASLEVLSATLAEVFPEIEVVSLAAGLSSLAENSGPVAQTGAAARDFGSLDGLQSGWD